MFRFHIKIVFIAVSFTFAFKLAVHKTAPVLIPKGAVFFERLPHEIKAQQLCSATGVFNYLDE